MPEADDDRLTENDQSVSNVTDTSTENENVFSKLSLEEKIKREGIGKLFEIALKQQAAIKLLVETSE